IPMVLDDWLRCFLQNAQPTPAEPDIQQLQTDHSPSAANTSRNVSGWWVCCAMRSISACNCSAVIIFDFLFELRLRHHCIERWLGIGALFRPDAVISVNLLDRFVISYAF